MRRDSSQGRAVEGRHQLSEHREDDVGVVPALVGSQDPLHVVEVAQELLGVRLLEGVPDVPERLAGHPGDVGQAAPDGDRVGHTPDVVAEEVVERQPPLVAQLHHHHRGEGLGVGGDQELVVRPGGAVATDLGDPIPSPQSSSPPRQTAAYRPGTRPVRCLASDMRRRDRVVVSSKGCMAPNLVRHSCRSNSSRCTAQRSPSRSSSASTKRRNSADSISRRYDGAPVPRSSTAAWSARRIGA